MSHELRQCIDSVSRRAREEELALLAGGDLAPEEAARLERHVERCPVCRASLAGLRESLAGLALLAADDLGPERPAERPALERVRAGVLAGAARIEHERAAGPAGEAERADGRRFRWALAAVLLVALLGAAVWLRSGVAPEPSGTPPERLAELPTPAAPPEELPPPPGPPTAEAPARSDAADRPDSPRSPARPDPPAEPIDPLAEPIDPVDPTGPNGPAPSDPPARLAEERPAEPRITIRIVSDDPDIVFYWLVEPEENRDETVSS